MTAPLPLKYGNGRSLVDKTRIRWGGLGDIVLGLLFLAAEGLGATLFGVLLLALGLASWVVTGFGTRAFPSLAPLWKAVVVLACVGYLFLAMFHLIWLTINKIVESVTKRPSA